MALVTCEHCATVMREEAIDVHNETHHPAWSIELNKKLDRIASALEGLERREERRG